MIERLLGDDLAAFVTGSDDAAQSLVQAALAQTDIEGQATIVLPTHASAKSAPDNADGEALLSKLCVDQKAQPLLEAIFGNVRVVKSVDAALVAHKKLPEYTYATRDGVVVLPDGRLSIGDATSVEAGSLERKRRIRTLKKDMDMLQPNRRKPSLPSHARRAPPQKEKLLVFRENSLRFRRSEAVLKIS